MANEPLDLDALAALREKSTPGIWKLWGMSVLADQDGTANADTAVPVASTYFRDEDNKPRTFDAQLMVQMHAALPALITAARDRDKARGSLGMALESNRHRTAERDAARAEVAALRERVGQAANEMRGRAVPRRPDNTPEQREVGDLFRQTAAALDAALTSAEPTSLCQAGYCPDCHARRAALTTGGDPTPQQPDADVGVRRFVALMRRGNPSPAVAAVLDEVEAALTAEPVEWTCHRCGVLALVGEACECGARETREADRG